MKIDKQTKPETKEKVQQLNITIPVRRNEILFHERLKELRKQNNLSQKEMAELLVSAKDENVKPLPYMTYVSYEQAPTSEKTHRLPPLEIVIQISELFKVSTDWLLGITDYPFREGHSVDFSSLLHFSKKLTAAEQEILQILIDKMNK